MGLKDLIFNLIWFLLLLGVIIFLGYFALDFIREGQTIYAASYFKGPIEGAEIMVYSINPDATKGNAIAGPFYTDEEGGVEITIKGAPKRIFLESVGGIHLGANLTEKFVISAMAPSNRSFIAITPFTTISVALAQGWVKKGADVENASRFANGYISRQYNILSILSVPAAAYNPDEVAASQHYHREYGLLLAGFFQLAQDNGVSPAELTEAVAKDWSDGIPDGLENGRQIVMDTEGMGILVLANSTALEDVQDAIDEFMGKGEDATNLKDFSIYIHHVSSSPYFYIDESVLPYWIDGEYGEYQLTAFGGKPPYAWKIKENNSMPEGFAMDNTGLVFGNSMLNPGTTEYLSPPFTVVAADSSKPPKTAEAELRISIIRHPPELELYDIGCEVGKRCDVSVVANVAGGTPPYYFAGYASDKGRYPLDLMIWQDGMLKGTPKYSGTYAMEVCVVDLVGWEDCGDISITVKEKPPPPPDDGDDVNDGNDDNKPSCEPGHYASYCGGHWRCCLNGWGCCGDGSCSPYC